MLVILHGPRVNFLTPRLRNGGLCAVLAKNSTICGAFMLHYDIIRNHACLCSVDKLNDMNEPTNVTLSFVDVKSLTSLKTLIFVDKFDPGCELSTGPSQVRA